MNKEELTKQVRELKELKTMLKNCKAKSPQ